VDIIEFFVFFFSSQCSNRTFGTVDLIKSFVALPGHYLGIRIFNNLMKEGMFFHFKQTITLKCHSVFH
jgi:hypothetical protein